MFGLSPMNLKILISILTWDATFTDERSIIVLGNMYLQT